ncbi:MAG TPA: triose-phosphate isomerase [Bryobacteraceae bacterium]|nr:triose-phosphate isomerase [Bryobacteraceae bacterium]
MRRPLLAGNWKMYKTAAETAAFFEKFRPLVENSHHCDIVICPPFPNLAAAAEAARGSRIEIGGQDLFWEREGAYTGEVSGPMLAAVGCRWVIIGHSERRQYFGETDEGVLKKTVAALEAGLKPIVCLGERLDEREAGRTEEVLLAQYRGGLGGLRVDQLRRVTIAYEPVWAIGTGRTATPEMAAEAHRFLRQQVAAQHGADVAEDLRILYGGSVKPDNIRGLMAQPEIDGVLVGGASLDPVSFACIVNF